MKLIVAHAAIVKCAPLSLFFSVSDRIAIALQPLEIEEDEEAGFAGGDSAVAAATIDAELSEYDCRISRFSGRILLLFPLSVSFFFSWKLPSASRLGQSCCHLLLQLRSTVPRQPPS